MDLRTGIIGTLLLLTGSLLAQSGFSPETVRSYPFPSGLTAAQNGDRIAWIFHEQGKRNIYVAEGTDYTPRRLTDYREDDGQELTSVAISNDGRWVVYLRGGEHGSNWDDEEPINPQSMPFPEKVRMYSISFEGGDPILLGEGANPVISPDNERVAFVKDDQLWTVPIEGGDPEQLFKLRGSNGSPVWSPQGDKLAFVSQRGDRAFIGIYREADTPIQWVAPDFNRDFNPRWSPDGEQLVFVRRPGRGGPPQTILDRHPNPWQLMTFNLETEAAKVIYDAPHTLRGSLPWTHGRVNLHWGDGRIAFLSYHDGWPHLYSVPEAGGELLRLTEGDYMCEYISMGPEGRQLVFAANTGPDEQDIDRRHLARVPIDRAEVEVLTPGSGLEWAPVITGNGRTVACISATAQRPPLPAIMPAEGGDMQLLGADRLPADFPAEQLVVPEQVVFEAPDGTPIHGALFEQQDGRTDKPAVVYVHGGPPRQMLLGWHYSSYYSKAYAMNQYLASQGFVVLSVNYRLGIGYGYDFHYPPNTGWRGAAEYQDIQAAGEWLAGQPQIDPRRIGIYGGSYGGYLTALALGKDSRLWAAGVDIHGVHDRTTNRVQDWRLPNGYEKAPDAEHAVRVAWESSPVAWVDGWTSPVLVIHGDDDRNVRFSESTDLVQRLRKKGVPTATLVIVDDSHHFMRYANQLKVNAATVAFLIEQLAEVEGQY